MLLSADSMWWWDGSRWHPATAATSGKPPRVPGSPWPWVIAALAALLLVTALPIWIVWTYGGGSAGLSRGFGQGFANTYLQQRQSAVAELDGMLQALSGCERAGSEPCYAAADDLRVAAQSELSSVRTLSGLVFFPSCLKGSAGAEVRALETVVNAAGAVRMLGRADSATVQLQVIAEGLRQAHAAVATSPC